MDLIQPTLSFDEALSKIQQSAHSPFPPQIFSGPPVTGDELKEEGMSVVMRKKAARQYRDMLVDALKVFPVRSRITVENLTGIVGRPPEGISVNSVGPAISYMLRHGLISPTGRMLKPGRKERHANPIREYEILKYYVEAKRK